MKRKFAQFMRLVWIDERLDQGTLNREDIAAAFGLSIQQASSDLKAYQTEHPDSIEYDNRAKQYLRRRHGKPAFPKHVRLQVEKAVIAIKTAMEAE